MAPTNKKIRVLVVEDSAFMRKVLEGIFNTDEQLQVVGNAKDGREAVALAESLKPDVITMDINMPHVDGLQATAEIMTTNPRPIVIVSSESKEGAASTLRALELGTFYICPGGQHLRITPTGRIQLDGTSGRIDGYLPNIDVTMQSVAAYAGAMSIAGVLTGMGNDGTVGAKAIKSAGGLVLAQDEATSVIFGMPAEAIKAGVVDQVLPIDDIYAAIEKRVIGICRPTPAGVR